MKIRIFALARELGLDSKVLIGLCDDAGIKLRNALATITPEERDQIVAYVRNRDSKDSTAEESPKDLAPMRDVNAGKVRDIRVMPSRPAREETPAEPSIDDPPAAAEPEEQSPVEQPVAKEPVAETPAAAEVPASEESDQPPSDDTSGEAATEQPTPLPPPPPPQKPSAPIQRMSRPARREMKPIGSVKDREQPSEQQKEKEKPARPLVAAPPSFQPPAIKVKPKKSGEKAMKPDISLDNIVDRSSPLADQLRQLKKARAEHDGDQRQAGDGIRRKPGARKGSLLVELRESREKQRQEKRQRRKKTGHPNRLEDQCPD